jgi:hypothetical protein
MCLLKSINANQDVIENTVEDGFASLSVAMLPVRDCFASGDGSQIVFGRIGWTMILIEYNAFAVVNCQGSESRGDPEAIAFRIEGFEFYSPLFA